MSATLPLVTNLSRKKREQLFEELKATCGDYIVDKCLQTECRVMADDADADQHTLLVEYPSVFDADGLSYVLPRVKIESGARSALDPNFKCQIRPYIADELANWKFSVEGITTIDSENLSGKAAHAPRYPLRIS